MHEVEKRDNGQQSSKYLLENSSLSVPFSSVANSFRKNIVISVLQCRNFSEKKENIEEEARFQVSL